jgi:transposase
MVAEAGPVARRRMRTIAEKRRIVEETLVRGASVAAIARKYDVNANLLFGWRRLHQRGLLEASREPAAKLLPVEVTTPTVVATRSAIAEVSKPRARAVSAGTAALTSHLEIEWPSGVRVRLQGSVDVVVLGTVLSTLAQQNR